MSKPVITITKSPIVPVELQGKKFKLIYADPAWKYKDKCHSGERGVDYKYDTMTLDEICQMRPFIDALADEDCLLAMWHVGPQPREALQVIDAWGFKLQNFKGFTWHKLTKYGKSHIGMGNMTRANTEDCLFAKRGKPKRFYAGVRQFVEAKIGAHSEKPDEVRKRLVQLMGDVPRVELFARQRFPGWAAWGNGLPQ